MEAKAHVYEQRAKLPTGSFRVLGIAQCGSRPKLERGTSLGGNGHSLKPQNILARAFRNGRGLGNEIGRDSQFFERGTQMAQYGIKVGMGESFFP